MAKIIKSIFNTSERRKSRFEDKEEDVPSPDLRRKLSISRSGRMRQANKKRQSLSLEVYGQEHQDKQKTVDQKSETKRRQSTELSPEEEIDSAFEIIDKT
ncbi:uncharacterized protein LOC123715480 [Pieris brassicae]|uniref:uncharacterized protein LOC123715480 n=1 Tax=Pieris brassicae TaxID=7116 RepID=UPI001E65FB0E|nr:uncharacterized protein LOC123715480 [Pieris brassicae]